MINDNDDVGPEGPEDDERDSEPGDQQLEALDQRFRNLARAELVAFTDEQLKPMLADFARDMKIDPVEIANKAAELIRAEQTAAAAAAHDILSRAPEPSAAAADGATVDGVGIGDVIKQGLREDPAGTVVSLLDKVLDRFMQFDAARSSRSNPFEWARKLSETQPDVAGYIGSLMSPDAMSGQVPLMLGNASTKAFDAGFKAGQVALRQTTGGAADAENPFESEPQSIEEEPPATAEPNVQGTPEIASMTSDRERAREATAPASATRRTLFSAMGDAP